MAHEDPNHEHPDDLAARLDGEKYGRDHAAEFIADHARDVQLLIETYAEDTANSLLETLRDLFWSNTWTPKEKR